MKKPASSIDLSRLPAAAAALIAAERRARIEAEERAVRLAEEKARLAEEKNRLVDEKTQLVEDKSRLVDETTRLAAEKARLAEEKAQLAKDKARLEYLVKEFQRALYGRKSEKISADQLELSLEDLQTSMVETETARVQRSGGAGTAGKPVSRKRNIGHLPGKLERIERTIEPDAAAAGRW